MTQATTIEWTDATWNPVRGCTKISPGCKHCYAEEFAERWRGVARHPYERGFDLRLVPSKLADPLRLTKPSRIFVNSMSDLGADGVPDEYVAAVAEVMRAASWHQFQLLTKRATRLRELAESGMFEADNVWIGVSVEDCKFGLPRVAELRATRARHRFLSCEPLLEHLGRVELDGIDWVIVGGESGKRLTTRPLHPAWAASLRDQCAARAVPFLFKQWGIWQPCEPHEARVWLGGAGQRWATPEQPCAVPMRRVSKGEAGRMLDGQLHDDRPSFAPVLVSSRERRDLVAHFDALARRFEGA